MIYSELMSVIFVKVLVKLDQSIATKTTRLQKTAICVMEQE